MSEPVLVAVPGRYSLDQPTPRLRWTSLSPMQAHERKLQQYWSVKTYEGSECTGMHGEWRDVPFEDD